MPKSEYVDPTTLPANPSMDDHLSLIFLGALPHTVTSLSLLLFHLRHGLRLSPGWRPAGSFPLSLAIAASSPTGSQSASEVQAPLLLFSHLYGGCRDWWGIPALLPHGVHGSDVIRAADFRTAQHIMIIAILLNLLLGHFK